MTVPSRRRILLRFLAFFGMAIFAVLWPPSYGINSHSSWTRLGCALLLVARATFIGYGTAMLLFRPMLTVRKPGEQELLSVPQAIRTLLRNGR